DSVSACFWDFGDGTTSTEINPEHIYNQSGTFDLYIEITLNNGNVQALEIPQFLNLYVPEADFNYAVNNMCEGGIVNFSASHAGDWNFGDGGYAYNSSQPVHTYTENGVYNVKFIVNDNPYGCVLENIKTVSLNKENFLFSFPDKVCAGEPFSVQTNISGYQSYSWEVSNGTVMPGLNTYFSLNESGTYFLTLYASKGNCTDTFYIEQPVRVIAPKADFSVLSPVVCDSGIVQLQNLSENASSFEWNVSNGDYSSNIEPSFSFTTVGTYNITLTAIQDGCRDTKIVESAVWVNPSPMVDFSVSAANNCYPVTVSVTDMSPGIVSQRVWNFNDGQTLLNTPSAVHTFLDSTVKTIKLTVTDSLGCVSSLEKPNILPYKGVISVDSITGCIPKTVYLHNSAPNSVQQTWIFGDGSFSNNNNVQHVYSDSGFYQILLISEYSQGCLDTAMLPYKIRVKEVKAVFSQNTSQLQGCIPLLVNYSDESVNALSWAWDFGDSTYSSVQNPGHIFFTPGEYTTRLVVTDLQGCYDTAFAPNPITALGPHISAAVDTVEGCGSLETHFLNNPETGVDYTWIFGDGNIKNSPTASHIYSPGVYVPFVTAIDTNNCEVTVPLDTITVHQLPEIEIQTIANHECVPFNVQLEVATPQDSMIWQVADTSFVNTPVFNFPMEKDTSYLVFVQLTDDNQCSSDTSIIISGNPVPDADFYSPDTSFSCFPANLHLTYNGKSEDSLQYIWSVGGLTFNSPSPVILLKDSGKYDVSLTVTNSFGCSASIRKENYFSLNDVEAPENSRIFSLVVSDDNNNLLVEWEKSNAEDFKDYTLYVSAYGEYLYRIAKTENNIAATQANLSHLNLENGIYNFKIQTMDICGNKIPLSELPEYNTILLQGNADTNQINLKWNRYKIAPFEKFVVMEKSPFQNNFAPIAFLSPDSLAYWTQKFFCKSGYSYKIIAENTYNTGYYSASNTITLYPENPYLHAQKVTITRTTVIDNDNEHFVLNEWKAPSVFPEAVKNYYLYRTTSASNKELLAVLPPYQTSFADYNVAVDDSSYIYTIEVENTCNVRGEKGNISNSILLNYQTTGNDVILNWNGYKGWGNHNLEKYLIRKKVNDSEWKTIYEASPTERFFKDDILKK
ncbi:MAG: PKD domain-containing protein, partial [Bacteroidetes bacterium]